MKTETIEVPSFEGFECVGLHIPNGKEHYVLSPEGDRLIQLNGYCVQVCYKKISPKMITLMCISKGVAQEGDYIQGSCGDFFKAVHIGRQHEKLWRPI